MKISQDFCISVQTTLFPMLEEVFDGCTGKMKELAKIIEAINPSRFINDVVQRFKLGRPSISREKIYRAFLAKAVFNFPTTKVLIEHLRTNLTLRTLCGWENSSDIPSEATFSRVFAFFAEQKICNDAHAKIIAENYTDKLVGHASLDSTAITGREKACRKTTPKIKLKRKRGRKSKAEQAALAEQEKAEIKTRRLELQPHRTLTENLADLPQGCDWGGKRDSKGKTSYWCGYKLHLAVGDGQVPLAAILSSASLHDSQVAFPLMQMTSERATVLYDLADSAYDAEEIKSVSKNLGHVPVIDPNPRRGETVDLPPAQKIRYRERTTVERANSVLKDNYGANHIRVKGHWKVLCHLMFGILVSTVKQLWKMAT